MIQTKRAYDPASANDGRRILVDRLWPRGLAKERAHVDEWLRDIAPSSELRSWFAHDPTKWEEFRAKYRQELAGHPDLLANLKQMGERDTVTLLFAARDEEHNNAVVLKELLEKKSN